MVSRVDINETDESIMTHLNRLILSFRDFKRIKPWQTHYLSFYFKVNFNQKDIVILNLIFSEIKINFEL
jgi:hypothetical protein